MKRLLGIVAVLVALCAFSDSDALQQKAIKHVEAIIADGTLTNVVQLLTSSGQVCQVKGHMWREGRPGENDGLRYLDIHTGTSYRTCRICGACQSQSVNDWK